MPDNIKIKDSHLFIASHSEIDAITHPLKKYFGVTSLVYQRNFNDGSEIRLSNQPDWIKHFYNKGYYNISGFEKHPTHYQSGVVVWSHLTHHHPILNEARLFNIDHGLTLIKKTADGCEFYFIGTSSDKPYITNKLINNIDFLLRFTAYFKEQSAQLLKKANSARIFIPKKFDNVVSDELGIPYSQDLLDINEILKIKKYHLNSHIILSKREVTCAKLLLQGKSARIIAEQLFISPRTVETHLKNLKEKLHCHTKHELIGELIKLNIATI